MAKRPGQPVRGSTTGRPIMALLDMLGKRWTLRIIWELNQGGPAKFRDLRAKCGDISPTVLNARMKDLRALQIVELGPDGYDLTEQGKSLSRQLGPLDQWASEWARTLDQSMEG